MANKIKGQDRQTVQVREAIENLLSCGLKRRAFRVEAIRHVRQRKGVRYVEYGKACIHLKDTAAVLAVLDRLKEKFNMQAVMKGGEIRFFFCRVPGTDIIPGTGATIHYKPGILPPILLDEKKDQEKDHDPCNKTS